VLIIYNEDEQVGHVGDDGGFAYSETWRQRRGAIPLSVTMPLDDQEVEANVFLTWAANLLPEADQLIMVGRRLGVAPGDTIGLLERIGRDTAGALSFGAPGARTRHGWTPIERDQDLERIIEELPQKPFLAGDDGVSMSLAGVQSKIAVARDEQGRLYIPLDGAPSTHILKPDSDRLFGSVPNEAFCLILARRCGLRVPDVSTGRAGKRSYLLIERYDRRAVGDEWRRLHQEDFCQALGLPPNAKYERNRAGPTGPSAADMLMVVRERGLAPDVLALLDAIVFNILACNTDAHAKNYSLMVTSGRPTMAPLYDVMCASVFDGITLNLAQSINGKTRGDHLRRRHWIRFLREAGLGPAPMLRRINVLAGRVLAGIPAAQAEVMAMAAGGDGLDEVAAAIRRRASMILEGLADPEDSAD
jgi:serine/threonine-protein kinase HipA